LLLLRQRTANSSSTIVSIASYARLKSASATFNLAALSAAAFKALRKGIEFDIIWSASSVFAKLYILYIMYYHIKLNIIRS